MRHSIGPKPARPRKTLAKPLAVVFLAGAIGLPLAQARAGSDPRTDLSTGWVTQEWPQDGQNPAHTNLVTAPFNVPGTGTVPVSWKFNWTPYSSLRKPFPGPVSSEFFDLETTKTKFGPYGLFFGLTETKLMILDPKTGLPFFPPAGGFEPCVPPGILTVIQETSKKGRFAWASKTPDCLPEARVGSESFSWDIVAVTTPGQIPPVTYVINFQSEQSYSLVLEESSSFVKYPPTIVNDNMYFANVRIREGKPGTLRAALWATMTEIWAVPLQKGVGLDVPLPKGEEPPPAQESYQPTTGVAIKGDIMVVGTARSYDKWLSQEGALFAIDPRDGSQKWIYKVSGRIMPNPAILSNLIIFGTNKGTVYAVDFNGNLRWRTIDGGQLMYPPVLFAPSELEEVVLNGPAVDASETYAYFGGSDGRIHRFDVQGGTLQSSAVLFYGRDLIETDANGTPIVRPCYINSPPAISDNPDTGSFLLVKCAIRNEKSWNASLLNIVKIPTLEHVKDVVRLSSPSIAVDPQEGYFVNGTATYGAVDMSTNASGGIIWASWDPILGTPWVSCYPDAGGDWYYLLKVQDDYNQYEYYYQEDTGGVSITNGMVTATDRGGNMIAIPSKLKSASVVVPAAVNITSPIPPYSAPFALPPVQVYPNPFRPAKAAGGTAKFKNLPAGSRVEIYTLAHEKVRSMTEAANQALWDGKNEAGQEVATGVYLYIIEIPDDKPIKGRLALIRN